MTTYHPDAYTAHGFPNVGDWVGASSLAQIDGEANAVGLTLLTRTQKFRGDCGTYYESEFIDPTTGWKFWRAWAYWSARGPVLALPTARYFWKAHGGTVRAEGHCGSPKPTRAVGSYHIDTPEGLAALVAALRDQVKT